MKKLELVKYEINLAKRLRLCKEIGLTAGMLKGSLAEGRKKS